MREADTLDRARAEYAELLEQSLQRTVGILSRVEGVRRVSVFGSYARGRRDLFTDLDVLVVMETDEGFVERVRRLYGMLALPVDLDLLCYTPEEFEAMQGRAFLKRALQEEVLLYEQKSA
jgi:predicted nucleotidyltransferase